MIPASAKSPLPTDLRSMLPNPQTPWNMSSALFGRVHDQNSHQHFRLCEVLNSDADMNFILRYFEHQKPPGYSIKKVICIHNPDHTRIFESTLKNMEREASNPAFTPKGKDDEPKADRARALARWESQASQFLLVEVKSSNSRQPDTCSKSKVLPLWHGSSRDVCHSVCSSGFTSFGKHHYFDESAQQGSTKSTDKGYFGSGIYFTNSAHYATMYSSEGHLLLSWVSMREPYPVVNDKPHPQKGSDMIKLGGKEHYQNYNAHFIPVASIRPHDPKCLEYYPCFKDQPPELDEFVVFYPAQTLPRFWIEIGVDFPKVKISELEFAGELLSVLIKLLDKKEVKAETELSKIFKIKVEKLLNVSEQTLLESDDRKFLKLAKRLMPEGENFNSSVANMLIQHHKDTSDKTSERSVSNNEQILVEKLSTVIPSKVSIRLPLPAIAFGKELWGKYIGDVGEEPPLPQNINEILQSDCPFFKGKKIEDTHLLTLIPKTVNGKPFTLSSLEELVKNVKQVPSVKYKSYHDEIKKQYGSQDRSRSMWVMITKDVIPGSRDKNYDSQIKLLKELSQKVNAVYEAPLLLEAATSILMEYLRSGKRLYSDKPETYTRCQERIAKEPNRPLVIGNFEKSGIRINLYFWPNDNGKDSNGLGGFRKI